MRRLRLSVNRIDSVYGFFQENVVSGLEWLDLSSNIDSTDSYMSPSTSTYLPFLEHVDIWESGMANFGENIDNDLGHQNWPSLVQVFTTNHYFEVFE